MRVPLLATVTGMTLIAILTGCGKRPESAPTPGSDTTASSNSTSTAAKPKPQFQKLIGRWERPDGGYVLELREVDGEGKFDAGYFNPSPINVERAQAFLEAEATKMVVVLRDTGYPGCTYKLTYDPKADQLYGVYFQAALQETYDVAFARQKRSAE